MTASTTAPRIWVYKNVADGPADALELEDTDSNWEELLSAPQVLESKGDSPAFCGCEFAAGSERRLLKNAVQTHCFIFDVDVWRSDRPPFTLDELKAALEGFRFIAYTSYSSTDAALRWRVILPVSPPVPISKHVPLFRWVNKHGLDNTVADKVRDATRYGYFGTVASEAAVEAYQWYVNPGEYLDWRGLDLADEDPTVVRAFQPGELEQRAGWTSMEAALEAARRRYKDVGKHVRAGENRHEVLLVHGCRLWWDWAFNEECVRDVLGMINANFDDPKDASELENELQRAYARVLGEERVEQYMPYGHEREPEARITSVGLGELGKTLRRANKEQRRVVGRAFVSMAAGEVFVETPADGPAVLDATLQELANAYPAETADRILRVIAQSLAAQRARSSTVQLPTDEEVRLRLVGCQARAREAALARDVRQSDVEADIINQAFQLVDETSTRTHRYTPQELKAWEARGFNNRRWVVSVGQSYFFWVNGEYWGPVDRDAAAAKGFVALFPAGGDGGLDLTASTKDGPRPRTAAELLRDYGTVALERRLYMAPGISRMNGSTLEMSAYRECTIAPARSERVEQWLQLLAGEKYEELQRWMARLYNVDIPSAALYLIGPKSTGKGLLVHGLSKFWGGATVFDRNEEMRAGLARSPLLWCDERMPNGWHQGVYVSAIRTIVSRTLHSAGTGYKVNQLEGHARLVMTGNDVRDFTPPSKSMSAADSFSALADRVVFITVPAAARTYLKELGDVACAEMVQHEIAAHALWLRENWKDPCPQNVTRFGAIESAGFTESMITSQEPVSRVYSWIQSFVSAQGFVSLVSSRRAPLLMDGGELLANATHIHEQWKQFDPASDVVPAAVISRALALLAPKRVNRTIGKRLTTYRALDVEPFRRWVDSVGGDWDDTQRGLEELREKSTALITSRH